MSKIICEICGTSYPDTADECPICGCSRELSAEISGAVQEEKAQNVAVSTASIAAAAKALDKAEKEEAFDEDDFDEDDFDEDYDEEEFDDQEEEPHKSNAGLVIALVIVIMALIAVTSFIVVKYLLPNMTAPETTAPSVVETTAAPTETTEPTVPCDNLVLTSGGEIVLEEEGANWLINVMALPENTTDILTYESTDESVAIVDEQGKVTAVGEGTAVIVITCGEQELLCTVTCDFTPETTAAPTEVTEPETEPTEPETEAPADKTGTITAKRLNIRETASSNGTVVGVYVKGDKVTILEEKTVNGTTWGRTDKGWISMEFVKLDN